MKHHEVSKPLAHLDLFLIRSYRLMHFNHFMIFWWFFYVRRRFDINVHLQTTCQRVVIWHLYKILKKEKKEKIEANIV